MANATIARLERWNESHQSKVFAFLRIALGLIIFYKGIYFIQNTEELNRILENSRLEFGSFLLAHYVAMSHLLGGILIAIGLITRIAIIFQLPVLLGAIIFVSAERSMFAVESELALSILVFILLVFFLFYGSGPLSVDNFMRKHKNV